MRNSIQHTSHYFSENQESEFIPFKIRVNINSDSFFLFSSKGVFSKEEVDSGSRLLIDSFKNSFPRANGSLLDLGCGYGVVGISLLRENPGLSVLFSDVNERALFLTKMNLKELGLKGSIIKSDSFSEISKSKRFDYVLLNPPISAGRAVCYSLIDGAKGHLKDNGKLLLVAVHNKGGSSLMKKMYEVFGNVKILSSKGGFRVYISENASSV